MKKKVRFSGDGGVRGQWIELFPYMTAVREDVLDIPSIITFVQKKGIKHFYVEQDIVVNPELALKNRFDYMKTIVL